MFVIRSIEWIGVVIGVAVLAAMVSMAFSVWFTSNEFDLIKVL